MTSHPCPPVSMGLGVAVRPQAVPGEEVGSQAAHCSLGPWDSTGDHGPWCSMGLWALSQHFPFGSHHSVAILGASRPSGPVTPLGASYRHRWWGALWSHPGLSLQPR